MRRLALLLSLAACAPLASPATRVTIGQAERSFASWSNLPDTKVAEKISGIELVERATSARLAEWQRHFPGKRTRQALLALADASAFLDLPLDEFLPNASPDTVTANRIYQRAVAYEKTVLTKLPNFYARRTTTHFDDISPFQRLRNQVTPGSAGYHASLSAALPPASGALSQVGDPVSTIVTYRDGNEVPDSPSQPAAKPAPPVVGLTTRGEFGPILSVVIDDAAHGKVFWSHWERGPSGPLAVFRYLVHQEESHFLVIGGGNFARHPSYHGQIAIDPGSGNILRITMVSDFKPPFQPSVSAILVEYGPVEIGNAIYLCPIKGVAIAKVPTPGVAVSAGDAIPFQTSVNDVAFTEYHVFRSELRILP